MNINQIITEAMGGCWHEWDNPASVGAVCIKCGRMKATEFRGQTHNEEGIVEADYRPDYTTPDGFFKAWRWAQQQKWWEKFKIGQMEAKGLYHLHFFSKLFCLDSLIDPQTFATALAQFLMEREK